MAILKMNLAGVETGYRVKTSSGRKPTKKFNDNDSVFKSHGNHQQKKKVTLCWPIRIVDNLFLVVVHSM